MAIRVLIFVDDPARLEQESADLAALCPDWHVSKANTISDALALLREQPCQVVACLPRQPQATGAQFLNEAAKISPSTLRILGGDLAQREAISQHIAAAFHFVSGNIDADGLCAEITRVMTLDRWLSSQEMRRLVSQVRTFPTVPERYFEVLKELRSENPSCERVGAIIAQDMAMSTKILQTLNSPIYGLARQITDPSEAVLILGFEMVKSLVLCIQVFSQFSPQRLSIASIDKVWQHSTRVAHAARKIALFEHAERSVANEAFAAGLLHDLGKLVLMAEFPDKCRAAVERARAGAVSVADVEKEVFGATHGELSAYLLVHWGMPISLGEAVAYHHFPFRSETSEFGPVCAVHAANALIHESEPSDGQIHNPVDERYLAQIGMLGHAQLWREELVAKNTDKIESEITYIPLRSPKAAPVSSSSTSSAKGLFKRLAFWK
jgi:HD-like signal output (HDOD) protein